VLHDPDTFASPDTASVRTTRPERCSPVASESAACALASRLGRETEHPLRDGELAIDLPGWDRRLGTSVRGPSSVPLLSSCCRSGEPSASRNCFRIGPFIGQSHARQLPSLASRCCTPWVNWRISSVARLPPTGAHRRTTSRQSSSTWTAGRRRAREVGGDAGRIPAVYSFDFVV
jgi:hypothetical protein